VIYLRNILFKGNLINFEEFVSVLENVLINEAKCPICMGLIVQAKVIKECSHRCCSNCIEKCLRVVKNECPNCRIAIPSRRSMLRDTTFDLFLFSLMDGTIGSKNFNDMRDDYWQRRNEDYRRQRKVQSLTVDQGLPL